MTEHSLQWGSEAAALAKACRRDIVRMIRGAGSGHIGGSLSSADIYIAAELSMGRGDRLVVSHGHTSAALYAVLGNLGAFDIEDAVAGFRRGGRFEGHPNAALPGVEWCSGSLGQGLSVGCGMALAKRLRGEPGRIFVVMGDGEQQKGQLQEAREFAVRQGLSNLVAVVDCNGLQASGAVADVGPQSLAEKYGSSGWEVRRADGHDFASLAESFAPSGRPVVVLAKTVMGRGIHEIENDYRYHGGVPPDEILRAAEERFAPTDAERGLIRAAAERKREYFSEKPTRESARYAASPNAGAPYSGGERDLRGVISHAIASLAVEQPSVPLAVLDCDLFGSMKLGELRAAAPQDIIECGIAEENASTVASALARSGVLAVHMDFAAFNLAETYGQLRMADLNRAPYKLVATHAGLDVGEDGKTHQSIDYISLAANLQNCELIIPADANQADAALRYALSTDRAAVIVAGRSPAPVLRGADGEPLGFRYGRADLIRCGVDAAIISCGPMTARAAEISDALRAEGIGIAVINASCPLALDRAAVLEAAETGAVVTYEDHNVRDGLGSLVAQLLMESGARCRFLRRGVTRYGGSAAPEELYRSQGLDAAGVAEDIRKLVAAKRGR